MDAVLRREIHTTFPPSVFNDLEMDQRKTPLNWEKGKRRTIFQQLQCWGVCWRVWLNLSGCSEDFLLEDGLRFCRDLLVEVCVSTFTVSVCVKLFRNLWNVSLSLFSKLVRYERCDDSSSSCTDFSYNKFLRLPCSYRTIRGTAMWKHFSITLREGVRGLLSEIWMLQSYGTDCSRM